VRVFWKLEMLDYELLQIGETRVTLATIATALVIFVVTSFIGRISRALVRRSLRTRATHSPGATESVASLVRYAVLIIGTSTALHTVGFNLQSLFAAGAVFAVGIGFAMQNVVQNFVAGIILLLERSIKPGDVLEVEGMVIRVQGLGIRTTIGQTRDGEELIIPNSVLAQGTVKNYTFKDAVFRIKAQVGVTYDSDMARVRQVLEDVARSLSFRHEEREPQVLMLGFGASSVDFELAVWVDNPWRARSAVSQANQAIWDAFKREGITIAFPQLDVHFDRAVADALRSRVSAAPPPPS
jgi:small-conductance mechanosensitive channel